MTANELLTIVQEIVNRGEGDLRIAYVNQGDGKIRKVWNAYPDYRSSGYDYLLLIGSN